MGEFESHWAGCTALPNHYVAFMSEKKKQRNVRIPAELERDIQKLADGLHEAGLLPEPNWSAALVVALLQAKKIGLLDSPPTWYQPPKRQSRRLGRRER